VNDLTHRTRLAHADAWQVIGLIHAERGSGRVGHTPGGMLMSSGLPQPQYNNVDVLDVNEIDIDRVKAWYAEQGVPWGARVVADAPWNAGRRLFRKRLMALTPERLTPVSDNDAIHVIEARAGDLDAVVSLDVSAFGGAAADQVPWLAPLIASKRAIVALASWNGTPAGTGYAVMSDAAAGRGVYVAGIGVEPSLRNRGVATALSSWLIQQAGTDRLAHLHPDSDSAARIYERLGFVEVPGFDVYVDIDPSAGAVE
jgi:GNAT superfamily N-acetyltransferase